MSDPFVGEIRLFGFPRIPDGWLPCNGQMLDIAQYNVLFALIQTTFGGDGVSKFGLPDLRGRVPIHQGTGTGLTPRTIGQAFGEVAHTLQTSELPSHSHALVSTTNVGTTATPAQNVHLAASNTAGVLYAPQANISGYVTMAAESLSRTGDNLPHDNIMPTLTCNFCIAYAGIYPST